ncbi:uncharacterized protein LOC111080767 [Drosophila obscura]|uniref:uncharacterized protein LOC111080767 n=1 Tax=Drosophila obscura TaxID=7282 RepID=UPI001BB2BE47|nr:uncharacterized protein LOC111080767 [Drosophila obscura]
MLLPCVLLLLLLPIIGQGLSHTLPQQKLRIKRDTRDLPTDLFKPVGGGSQSMPKAGQNGTAIVEEPTDSVEFLEKVDGQVEAVTESEETGSNQPWPNYPPNSVFRNNFPSPPSSVFDGRNNGGGPVFFSHNRAPIANGNNFPTGPFYQSPNPFPPLSGTFQGGSAAPRSSSISGSPRRRPSADSVFQDPDESRDEFLERMQRTFPSASSTNPVFYGGSPNSIPYPSPSRGGSSMTPFFSGPIGPTGPIGSSSSSFQRSSHFSFSSDGNGPPQIEQSVYDSRMPRFDTSSSSMRYF